MRKLPLRLVLTLPFVAQTVGAVALVGYLSFRSGRQAVAELANHLMGQQGDRIVQNLDYYFQDPKTLVRENQAAIKLRILGWQNTSLIESYFVEQLKINANVSGLMITTESKEFLAVGRPHPQRLVIRDRNPETGALENYVADLQGNRLYLQDTLPNYDPHADPPTNPWYQAAKADEDGFWQPVVSLVRGKKHPILMMAYFLQFTNSQGEFQGVLSTSVYLDQVGEFLRRLQIGKTGQAFIMDEKGLLIATSTTEQPFRLDPSIQPKETSPPEALRLAAQDSQNPITQAAAAWSLNQRDSLEDHSHPSGFRVQNKQYFGRVIPFKLDDQIRWTIVVVVPESDFMAEIQANVYRTVILCGLALLGAIGSGIWTSRRITRSLLRLTQATQAIAAGVLEQPLPVTRIAEVECLTQSFHQMVMDLQKADQLRQNYAQDLERQVASKTAALTEAQRIAKVGSWEFNLATQEVIWSEELYRIYEAEEQAPVPRPDLTIQHIHPDDQERFQQEVVEAAIALKPFDANLRIITQKGNIRYIQAKGQPIANAQGEVVKLVGTVADITDQKAAEIAWRESELKFSSIFHTSPDPAWIATLAEGRLLNTNERMATFLGYSQAEMLGKTCVELNLWVNHEDLAYFRKQLIQNRNIQDFEVVFRLKSGELRTVLLSAIVSHLNCQDCVIGLLKDISDRKRAEAALRQSEERFQEIASTINQLFFIRCAKSRQFLYVSPAYEKMFGRSCESLYQNSESWLEALNPDDRQQIITSVFQQFQGNNVTREYRIIRPDHSIRWIYVQISLLQDEAGKPLRFIGFAEDITDRKQIEENLQRYERIVSATADGIALLDRNYIYQVVNQTYLTWHNKSYEEIIGHSVKDLLGSDVFETLIKDHLDRCLAGETVRYQHWFKFNDEPTKPRFLDVTYSPFLEADNTISGVVVGLRELTEQKQAEQALRKSEERYRQIIETADEGIWIIDLEGNTTFVNPKMAQMLGYSAEEMFGKPLFAFMDEEGKALATQKLERRRQGIEERHEFKFRRKDGSDLWALIATSLIFDESGQSTGVLGMITDISDRKQAEIALKESESRFLEISDSSPANIYIFVKRIDGSFYFEHMSRAIEVIHEISVEQILENANILLDAIYPEDQAGYEAAVQYSMETLQLFQHQWRIITPSGKIKWLQGNSRPKRRDNGEIAWHGIVIDISDRKQAEDELQQAKEAAEAANRAKSNFLANMSHELRTPLNGIMGYAQILQQDKNCTPKQKEGIGIIYQCGTHLLTLINDILDLSKIEAEKLELYPENFHFPSFLTALTEIFSLKSEQKKLTFTYLPLIELPTVIYADQKRLRQVLMNLLSNAVKFSDRGSVTFKVSLAAAKIRFEVEDTGIGMTPEQLTKIFLPFEQVGDNSRRNEGTGLGLAITQKIISIMGSKIFVESTPEVGSRFWFDLDLPIASSWMEPTSIKSSTPIIGYEGERRKLLIVDDRWENRSIVIKMLEPIGFELIEAVNGQDGLEKAIEVQPDLIIADLVMPVMNGWEMARRLRELPQFQSITIIAISANAFEVDRQKSLEAGCNDFLPKPVQAEDLLNQIKNNLNLSWIYDPTYQYQLKQFSNESSYSQRATQSEIVIPPSSELVNLYQAAQSGKVQGVEHEIMRLQQLSPEYIAFAIRIMELAADFEYEEIAQILEPYLS